MGLECSQLGLVKILRIELDLGACGVLIFVFDMSHGNPYRDGTAGLERDR